MNATSKSAVVGVCLFSFTLLATAGGAYAEEAAKRLDRAQVDLILAEAREAIDKGEFDRAETLIAKTEKAGVRYPLLHRGDTPSKARRDLEKSRKGAPASDPFLAAKREAVTAMGGAKPQPRALPKPTPTMQTGSGSDRYALNAPKQTKDSKAAALTLVAQSRSALAAGDLRRAEQLAARANELNVPSTAFGEGEDSPTQLAWDLQRRRAQMGEGVVRAGGVIDSPAQGASQAIHVPEADQTKNQQVATLMGPDFLGEPSPARVAQLPQLEAQGPSASRIFAAGESALKRGDLDEAYRRFQEASTIQEVLTVDERRRLGNHLQMFLVNQQQAELPQGGAEYPQTAARAPEVIERPQTGFLPEESMIDAASADQQVLARQLSTEVGQTQVEARSVRESDPRGALEMLEKVKVEVENSGLSEQFRDQLARRVDRSITETKKYIEDNRAQIELDERNAAILAEIDREKSARLKVRESIAENVNEFNKLNDEQRYEEAQVIAKRLYELDPDDPVVQQVWQNAKLMHRERLNRDLREQRDEGNWLTWQNVEDSAVPDVHDGAEMKFGPDWEDTQKRSAFSESQGRRTEREIEIQRRLKTPVQLRYNNRPLSEVMESLSQMTGVNIYLDPRGLSQEGVSSDTPVSINLSSEVMLKSALNLILEPLHLGYTVKDEVLKITSKTLRDGDVYTETYYVADLVIPIPNFVPSNNIGLQGLINDALAVTGYGAGGLGAPGPIALANNHQAPGGPVDANANVLAQNFGSGPQTGTTASPLTTGPGGLGGAAQADFDSLIDLIVSTVQSDTWAENGGGEAEIRPFPTNLSLVVSQTQAAHEEIADLLEQLRRLQDLQVTIEVRFIRLSDDFFERIGIDFDLNINDNTTGTEDLAAGGAFETPRSSLAVGAEAPLFGDLATLTADLDVPFRQGGFDVALPTFGGFNPSTAATFGFAILSDIEAYFLINAAQGDSRTNVLNAPKVTLFNGQQAFVSDTSQSPFVISVIPVVGEFAAAQQPVIVVLSEGTLMSIQAVVSDDRRYVRLTVVPFFSEIGDVDTFTFDGQTTTNNSSSSSSTDDDGDGVNETESGSADSGTVIAGTTVQLPTFQFVSVTTTVSVPDGGTVLLGGIKRLSEGREEFGVPLLSKVPYINRLFRNVGIGRETDSLMMMVTPRIIIQEEEEERLGLASQ